jgi:hypothetical protein
MRAVPDAGLTQQPFAGGFGGLASSAALQLNSFGKRFANEDVPGQPFTNQLIHPPKVTNYQI